MTPDFTRWWPSFPGVTLFAKHTYERTATYTSSGCTRFSKPDCAKDAAVIRELFELYYEPKSGFLAFTEHQAIADAISAGDQDKASTLMLAHINSSLERFGPTMSMMEENQ
jgi:hypothetical protein